MVSVTQATKDVEGAVWNAWLRVTRFFGVEARSQYASLNSLATQIRKVRS